MEGQIFLNSCHHTDLDRFLGFTIDKYVWTMISDLSPVLGSSYKMSYRIVEEVADVYKLQHPLVRAVLTELDTRIPLTSRPCRICQAEQALAAHRLLPVVLFS